MALNASLTGDNATALACLEEAVFRPDSTAVAHFLLGAEYAQTKQYDRALFEFETAVAKDPNLIIARFQLGLLLLTSGDAQRSLEVLHPLLQLGSQSEFAFFAAGLIHLMRDEFSECVSALRQGMALNVSNHALNLDMQRIVVEAEKALGIVPIDQPASGEAESTDASHIFLSAYKGNASH